MNFKPRRIGSYQRSLIKEAFFTSINFEMLEILTDGKILVWKLCKNKKDTLMDEPLFRDKVMKVVDYFPDDGIKDGKIVDVGDYEPRKCYECKGEGQVRLKPMLESIRCDTCSGFGYFRDGGISDVFLGQQFQDFYLWFINGATACNSENKVEFNGEVEDARALCFELDGWRGVLMPIKKPKGGIIDR